MPKKSRLVFKVLTNRFHSTDTLDFREHLSESERYTLNEIPVASMDTGPLIRNQAKDLSLIHYSWIAPHIKAFPPSMAEMMLLCLDTSQKKRIAALLDIKPCSKKISPLAAEYYLNMLSLKVLDPSILPREYLQDTPLTPLLDLNKAFLVEVIDLFGVHDLGEKIRAIVDKTKLRAIYQSLSPVQLKFLDFVLRQTEKAPSSEINLTGWDGSPETLQKNIHKQGLVRLAKAVSKESSDYLWHLKHRLDTGRAAFLDKNLQNPGSEEIVHLLKNQLITIFNLINHKREP